MPSDSGTGYLVATRKAANRKLDRNRNGNGNLHKKLHGKIWNDWDLVHKHLWCLRSDLVHKLKNTITQWWTSSFTYWEVGLVTLQSTLSGISIRNGYTCPLVGSDQYWNLITGKPVVGPVGLSLLTWIGWVLSGPTSSPTQEQPSSTLVTHTLRVDALPLDVTTSDRWLKGCNHLVSPTQIVLCTTNSRRQFKGCSCHRFWKSIFDDRHDTEESWCFAILMDRWSVQTKQWDNAFAHVVFGVSSSPFLLNATIRHHLKKHAMIRPDLVNKLLKSTYVDDIVTGAESEEAPYNCKPYKESKEILKGAGFNLRKFKNNSS